MPFKKEPPKAPLKALWFGLFNPCPDGRTPVADIYLCGSNRFDPDPKDNSWAVQPDWWPERRYARSAVLTQIYQIAYRQGAPAAEQNQCLGNDAEFPLVLAYGAFTVRQLVARTKPSLLLGQSDSLGIAVGFDCGDFVLLGELSHKGLQPICRKAMRPGKSITAILENMRSRDTKLVFRAMLDLHRFGKQASEAVTDLIRIAKSGTIALRQLALGTLAKIAPQNPAAKDAAFQALQDKNPMVRCDALRALISFRGLSPAELGRIKAMENDSDKDVARWSEITLRNIHLRKK